MDNFVKVWFFNDAPEELQKLSPHMGDEDWVALVPAALAEHRWAFSWLDEPRFGNCVSEHKLDDGSFVYISAHA